MWTGAFTPRENQKGSDSVPKRKKYTTKGRSILGNFFYNLSAPDLGLGVPVDHMLMYFCLRPKDCFFCEVLEFWHRVGEFGIFCRTVVHSFGSFRYSLGWKLTEQIVLTC
jgi:hypothetical protein